MYALHAAAVGLGIGLDDEVLVPAHTYMATATSVLSVGVIPVIVDIDESLTIDPNAIEDAIGPATRAVIPVHLWGGACDMDAIRKIAKKHDLLVIEDACTGIGGAHESRMLRERTLVSAVLTAVRRLLPFDLLGLLRRDNQPETVCRGKAPSPSGCESRPANCRSSR